MASSIADEDRSSSTTNENRLSVIFNKFLVHLKRHFLLKVHYFLFFGAFGMLYPILNITLRSRGLSNVELSYINIIIPFLIFIGNPLLGFISDHTRRYLLTFNFVFALCTILYTLIFVLPTVRTHHIQGNIIPHHQSGPVLDFCASQEVATICASRSECGCSYRANCTTTNQSGRKNHTSFIFSMTSSNIEKGNHGATCGIQYKVPVKQDQLANCIITCSIPHYCQGQRYPGQARTILFYSILFVLGTTLISNSISLGVSIGFATVTHPEDFGAQRVYGTVGFGIAAFVASRIYQIFKIDLVYIIMFSITSIFCIIVTSFIRVRKNETVTHEKELDDISVEKKKTKESKSRLATLLPLFKKLDVLVFLSLTCVWGMSYAGLDPYLYLYIDELAACKSHSVVGWMSLTASVAEVIGFFVAAKLLKLMGTNLASIVILLAFAIRFAGYYFIPSPYFLIPIETMHFFNFGILYVLIAQKADSIAPPGLAGTLQGIALGVAFGLGRGVGLPIASFIYTTFEHRRLFLVISLFNLTAAVIYSIYFIIQGMLSKKKPKQIISEDDTKSKIEPLLVVENEKN